MSIFSCRGDEAKRKLLKEYFIKPVSYIKLLPNQKKAGCCGDITDRYYAFECEHRKTKQKIGFFAGYSCGEKLIQMIGMDKHELHLFDPLKHNLQSTKKKAVKTGKSGQRNTDDKQVKTDMLNQEVYDAIHLIVTAWSGSPYGDYANIISFIRRKPDHRVSDKVVEKVNFLVSKDSKHRTLKLIVNDLRKQYPNIKEYSFDELNKVSRDLYQNGKIDKNYIYGENSVKYIQKKEFC